MFGWTLWVGFALIGCDQQPGESGAAVDADSKPLRIVSLAPALTQMLVDMGFADRIVAVAQNDMAAPPGVPVVGNYRSLDAEALLAADPTVVLTMSDRNEIPPLLIQLADEQRFKLVVYPSPLAVSEVAGIIFNNEEVSTPQRASARCLGTVLGRSYEAFMLATRLDTQLRDLEHITQDAPKPRVLLVFNTQPVMACGPGTVHDQLLGYVGAVNALTQVDAGQAPVMDQELILAADPDVILLLLPGDPPLGTIDDDDRLAVLRNLDVPAVTENRVVLISDPLALLPSSSLARLAAEMAKGIHPDLVESIDQAISVTPEMITEAASDSSRDTFTPVPVMADEDDRIQWLNTEPDNNE